MADPVVLEPGALAELLLGGRFAAALRSTLRGRQVHVTDQVEVGAAVALLELRRRGRLSEEAWESRLALLVDAPFQRHPSRELLTGAARRRHLRLEDALCVELSDRLQAPLVTTSSALAAVWDRSWLVTPLPPGG